MAATELLGLLCQRGVDGAVEVLLYYIPMNKPFKEDLRAF